MGKRFPVIVLVAVAAYGQTQLDRAYDALRAKDYDHAIAAFQQSVALAPERLDIRTDLAYTLLRVGESEAARDRIQLRSCV